MKRVGGSARRLGTGTDEQSRPRRAWMVVWEARYPSRVHLQMVPTLAKVHTSVRQNEEERAQEIAPGMARLEPAQV
jgi:hypothetical protein